MSTHVTHDGELTQYNAVGALQQNLLDLLETGSRSDMRFVISGSKTPFCAHSSVISVRCRNLRDRVLEFLRQKRDGKLGDENVMEVTLKCFSEESFSKVLRYIYTGKVTLTDDCLYDICCLSATLGIPSLQNIVFTFLDDDRNMGLLSPILDMALCDSYQNVHLIEMLTERFSENCFRILRFTRMGNLSSAFMQHIVKQENLNASEYDLWSALVSWACWKCDIEPEKPVSEMTLVQRRKVSEHLASFCRPSYLRILNFDTDNFAQEVEPLGVFPSSEILLKYRFDATAGLVEFDHAFPDDRYSFLTRIRHRTMSFESNHPHSRGTIYDRKVQMPRWVSEMEINFDQRTEIGRYGELAFYLDSGKQNCLFSLRYGRSSTSKRPTEAPRIASDQSKPQLAPLRVDGNCFWFSFYSPQNVGDLTWGFKFHVAVVNSIGC